MTDNQNEILTHLMEIKVDLAIVKTDTGNIKEDVSETKDHLKTLNGRTSVLERWQSKIAGGFALLTVIIGAIAWFK